MKVAITGASGFVGRALCHKLDEHQIQYSPLGRQSTSATSCIEIDYSNTEALIKRFTGHQTLIHLIGKTHSIDSMEHLENYRRINVELTLKIAEAAATAKVKHVIFMSSIKAIGEGGSSPYNANTKPEPTTAYGISKLEAEGKLAALCRENGMTLTVFRPPLIYDKDAKGNISTLLKAIKLGLPLPFKAINNRRSLITLETLCELVINEIKNDAPRELILPVSNTLSTSQLVERIGKDHQLKPRLIPLPTPLLKNLLTLTGKRKDIHKLCGDLIVAPNENYDTEPKCQ